MRLSRTTYSPEPHPLNKTTSVTFTSMKWHFNTMELHIYQTSKQGEDRKHTALVKDKRGHKVLRTSPDLWFYDIMNRIKRWADNKVLPTLNLTTYQQTTKRGNPTAKREKSKQNKRWWADWTTVAACSETFNSNVHQSDHWLHQLSAVGGKVSVVHHLTYWVPVKKPASNGKTHRGCWLAQQVEGKEKDEKKK